MYYMLLCNTSSLTDNFYNDISKETEEPLFLIAHCRTRGLRRNNKVKYQSRKRKEIVEKRDYFNIRGHVNKAIYLRNKNIFNGLENQTLHLKANRNRATSWENLFLPYANKQGADQPAHPRSLISTFVVRNTYTC